MASVLRNTAAYITRLLYEHYQETCRGLPSDSSPLRNLETVREPVRTSVTIQVVDSTVNLNLRWESCSFAVLEVQII